MRKPHNPSQAAVACVAAVTVLLVSTASARHAFLDACGTVTVNGVPATNVLVTAWFCDDDDTMTNDVLAASTVSNDGLPDPYNYHVQWDGAEDGEEPVGAGYAVPYYVVFSYGDCDPVIVTCEEIGVLIDEYRGKVVLDVNIVCEEETPPGGGGLTPGFWQNKNGQALIDGDDIDMLNDCCLRNEDGTDADFANKQEFRSWIRTRRARNMAYQLSGHVAAMKLNVANGFVNGDALVYLKNGDMVSINDLLDDANDALCDDGLTLSGDENRAYQELLKDALDKANNNQNWVNP